MKAETEIVDNVSYYVNDDGQEWMRRWSPNDRLTAVDSLVTDEMKKTNEWVAAHPKAEKEKEEKKEENKKEKGSVHSASERTAGKTYSG
jgi:hypothetical protein